MTKMNGVLKSIRDILYEDENTEFGVYVAKNLNNELIEIIIKPDKKQKG